MTTEMTVMIANFTIYYPFVAAIISLILGYFSRKLTAMWAILTSFVQLCGIVYLLYSPTIDPLEGTFPVLEIPIAFNLYSISLFVALIPALLGFLSMVYSYSYQKTNIAFYYTASILFTTAMVDLVLTQHLVWTFIFMEIATISSALLVSLGKRIEAREAALKYTIITIFTAAATVTGIAVINNITGTLILYKISWVNLLAQHPFELRFAITLIFVGLGTKAAIFPFYFWLPDAHSEAPAPTSVLLSGGKIKIASYAVFGVIFKLVDSLSVALTPQSFLDIGIILAWIGVITMVIGNIMALAQTDLKRMLAYCSVSQIGYIVIGFSLGTAIGTAAALFHMLTHSLAKSTLFMGAGSVEHANQTRDIDMLGSLATQMPLTTIAMVVGSLSISGIPPFGGYTSKRILYEAFFAAGHPEFAIMAMLVSALTLVLFLKMLSSVFFGIRPHLDLPTINEIHESPKTMTIPMLILAFLCLVVGVLPDYIMNTFIAPGISTYMPGKHLPAITTWPNILAKDAISGNYSPVPTAILIFIGLAIGAFLYWRTSYKKIRSQRPTSHESIVKTPVRKLPFTGGFYERPYLSMGQLYVPSTAFEFASGPILKFVKKFHNGKLSTYLWYISLSLVVIFMIIISLT